ncbi:MAG: response regulator, partial [Burkholderiaceae bacterium]
DDDQAVIVAMRARLAGHYNVIGVTNPRQAVEIARIERPDLILCDIRMPGLNGDEVVYALSEDDITARIPVVYLSSLLPGAAPTELGGEFGGGMGVPKRASTAQLLEVIQAALAR